MAAIRNARNADLICERLGENWTLRQIARELGCTAPAITTWAREDNEFATRYARAMDLRADRMADELLEISDDGSNDWMEREGIRVTDHEHIQRSRLRVDSRKWLLSKMAPKVYGERTTLAGDPDQPLVKEIDNAKLALMVMSILNAPKSGS